MVAERPLGDGSRHEPGRSYLQRMLFPRSTVLVSPGGLRAVGANEWPYQETDSHRPDTQLRTIPRQGQGSVGHDSGQQGYVPCSRAEQDDENCCRSQVVPDGYAWSRAQALPGWSSIQTSSSPVREMTLLHENGHSARGRQSPVVPLLAQSASGFQMPLPVETGSFPTLVEA